MTASIPRAGDIPENKNLLRMAPLDPLYRVRDLPPLLKQSKARIYELIHAGRLRTVQEHGVMYVTASGIAEYVQLLENEAITKSSEAA